MNQAKLQALFGEINKLANELHLTKVAYGRLSSDRGLDMKIVLGDHWKLMVCYQNSPSMRGIDMIILGLQKHLTAKAESLKEEIKRLKVEVDKEIEGAA